MSETEIIDISPPISEASPVWPGDTPFSRKWNARIADGSNIDLSALTTTVHVGAHADAPSHYRAGGNTIDQVDLTPYLGRCVVVDARGARRIQPEHCAPALASGHVRLLFKTRTHREGPVFETDFAAFSPEAVQLMGESGVLLAGIDTNSVDPFDSKDLPAHQMFARFHMRNLEGLDLLDVTPGEYELIALPLKLAGFDASPVRAVLRRWKP
ncbi:MAG: metal-dependent hydrolase/cyclase [Pseudomonadota bacterium]|jgi:arylformamidase